MELGNFRYRIQIGDPESQRFETLDALVDTGASYTWVPGSVLARLDIAPRFQREFVLADGRLIRRDVAQVLVRIDGQSLFTLCVFGDEGTSPLLGAVTLEEFGLAVDPLNKRLIPVPGLLTLLL